MPVKRRSNKRRDSLSADAIAWLEGRPSFHQFKELNELVPLWREYGDPNVATWDEGRDSKPRAIE